MDKLKEYRDQIDAIDTEIIKLFEQRMDVVKNVSKYKQENNIPTTDSNRESTMLEKNLSKLENEEYKKYYHSVLEGFLTASKAMQNELNKK